MPQECQVLRCYSCLIFQVHLVKKQKKWQCKMCNMKQSVKQVYGKGSGKDCRLHVMKLKELQFSGQTPNDCDVTDINELEVQDCDSATETFTVNDIKSESKWSLYMDKDDEISDEEKEMNYKVMENEFCYKKRRKLNKDFGHSSSEMSFPLSGKCEYESTVGTEIKNNEKPAKELKEHGMTFRDDCSVKSASKWSAFIDREQCFSDEECNETKATFTNKIELCQFKSKALLDEESFKTEKSGERARKTCSTYNKYSVHTHFKENSILTGNKEERTGNLSILETISDGDDLDEILNI